MIEEAVEPDMEFLRAERMESIATMAAGMAHGLNNVLAPIMMGVELLSEVYVTPEQQEILETIRISAQRAAAMVSQVLSFARGIEVRRVPVDLPALAAEAAQQMSETPGLQVRLQINNPQPVLGDPVLLRQVLHNLCVNARDAMPEGGELLIAVTGTELSVRDTGEGIKPEVLGRIFEPFFTTREIGRGAGMGLSTVHAIVKGHEGRIEVDTEPGRGSTFRIYL